MKVATNAVIENGIAIARCDNCGQRFYRSRADHRFCSITCNHEFHIAERRAALELFRTLHEEGEEEERRAASARHHYQPNSSEGFSADG